MFMKTIVGQKVGMTRVIDDNGQLIAATVIEAKPNAVTQIKTVEKDGYSAIQLGFGDLKRAKKPQLEHSQKAGAKVGRYFIEVHNGHENLKPGDSITVETFQIGDIVNVTGVSKGHGFTGTVKRHNFTIGPRSHGSKNQRKPGSIGGRYPQRVLKGKRMAGHMGAERVKVKHLKVVDILPEDNLMIVTGSMPGVRGSDVIISASPRHQK